MTLFSCVNALPVRVLALDACMSDAQSDAARTFTTFCSPEGRRFVTGIARSCLPYDPHDYVIDGTCKALDGIDLLAVLATGGGKMDFYILYLLVLKAIAQNPFV